MILCVCVHACVCACVCVCVCACVCVCVCVHDPVPHYDIINNNKLTNSTSLPNNMRNKTSCHSKACFTASLICKTLTS